MSMSVKPLEIGFLLFPQITQLDLTGPFEVFARLPDARVHVAWRTQEPVTSDVGLTILPTCDFQTCPPLDIICIPGGPGINQLLNDEAVVSFVAAQGQRARFVTSVCTGALLLGAAGLIDGYNATTHWASMQFLEPFGAEATDTRICIDRNRITGGGVTAGIDFGLTVAAELADVQTAERIQLYMEYNPRPPFEAGSPRTVSTEVLDQFKDLAGPMIMARAAAVEQAARRLYGTGTSPQARQPYC